MSVVSKIPKCAWIIIAIPTALLILSFSWLVFTYSCVIKSAKEATLTTPWITIAFKVKTLDDNVQQVLAKYNELIETNAQLIEQLNEVKKVSTTTTSKQNFSTTASSIPVMIDRLNKQSVLLMDQKQKLQGISSELQNVKDQLKIPDWGKGK
jgi:hypothetical protein